MIDDRQNVIYLIKLGFSLFLVINNLLSFEATAFMKQFIAIISPSFASFDFTDLPYYPSVLFYVMFFIYFGYKYVIKKMSI